MPPNTWFEGRLSRPEAVDTGEMNLALKSKITGTGNSPVAQFEIQ